MTEEEESEEKKPKHKVVLDEKGEGLIYAPNLFLPKNKPKIPQLGKFEIHFIEFNKKPKDFTDIQNDKEKNNLEKILDELKKLFKGWL